jgi:hypothetical protein
MRSAAAPVLLIILGCLWFLKSTALLPNTTTLLALLLAVAGIALLLLDGLNKSTLVSSPLLVYAGAVIYLYDAASWRLAPLIALGMVLAGVLMLVARSPRIPERRLPVLPNRHHEQD